MFSFSSHGSSDAGHISIRTMQMVGEGATWWGEALNWDAGGAAVERPAGLGQVTAFICACLPLSVNGREGYYFSLRAAV